ncbi:MAG: tetratricopeptide repeat protein [Caldilineaceae bacterium]
MSYYPQFADQVGKALSHQARSQAWLAQRLGLARGTVSRWLSQGTRPESPEMVMRVADVLGIQGAERQALLVATGYGYEVGKVTASAQVETRAERAALFVGVLRLPNHFVGRDELVEELANQLIAGSHLALSAEGLPGVGKTTLAVALAHHPRILDHFHDGVLWAGLGPTPDIMSLLARWGQELGRDISTIDNEHERAELVKNAIGQRHLLLVIDDAWAIEPAEWLRCGGPNCRHLLTTRNQSLAEAFAGPAQVTRVPLLSHAVACQLLAKLAPQLYAAHPAALQELAHAVDGLPLALELLGGYLAAPEYRHFPELHEQALDEMTSAMRRLQLAQQRLGANSSAKLTLQEIIALSLEELPQRAVRAFYALGAFAPKPETFRRAAAEAVTTVNTATIALLIDRNLLEKSERDNLTLHQTLCDVARVGVQPAAIARHESYYLELVNHNREDWQQIAESYGQIKWAWTRMTAERRRLDFVEALEIFQKRRGLWHDARQWVTQGLALAETYGWALERAKLLKKLGAIHVAQGRWEEGVQQYQASIRLFQAQQAREEECVAYNNLGGVYYRQAKWREAMAAYQTCAQLAQEIEDQRRVAHALMGIGNIYHIQDDWENAIQFYQQSLSLIQDEDDRYAKAQILGNLGNVYDKQERWEEALAIYHQSLALFQALGDRQGEAQTFNNLGNVYANQGQLDEAMVLHQKSLTIFRALEDRHGESQTLNNIGLIYKDQGKWQAAIQMYEADLAICRTLGDRYGESETLTNLGNLYDKLGQKEEAGAYWRQALACVDPGSADYRLLQERLQTAQAAQGK